MESDFMLFDSKDIYINIFVDEKKKVNNKWNYIGMLIVKEKFEEEIISFLKKTQEEENISEMKYKDVKINSGKYRVAMKWIDFICEGFLSHSDCKFFINILGIDIEKLNYSFFGAENESEKYYHPYNRFFRTVIKSSWSHFFKNQNVNYVIRRVFHDTEGVLETQQPYFKIQLKKAFEEDNGLKIMDKEIKFVNSNPDEEKYYKNYSYFIELIDLILGVVSFAYDYKYDYDKVNAQKLEARKNMALKLNEILHQIFEKKAYLKNFDVSFFPTNEYGKNVPAENLFFKRKPVIFGQKNLDEYINT